jgi:hypothetical protein
MEMQYINNAEVEELRRSKEAYAQEVQVARQDSERNRMLADRRHQTVCDLSSDVSKFLKALADDEAIDSDYSGLDVLRKWFNNDTLDNPFVKETEFTVTVTVERTYSVLVKHPTNVDTSDIQDELQQAFDSAGGDEDDVSEDLGNGCHIEDISRDNDDLEVDVRER